MAYGDYAGGGTMELKKAGIAPSAGGLQFSNLLGPISQGLNLAQGLFQAAGLFSAASRQTSSYRALRALAPQVRDRYFAAAIDIEEEGRGVLGTMTAQFGKSGSLLEGSPLLVLADSARKIEDDVVRTMNQGRIEMANMLYEARQMKKAAKSTKRSGIAGIVGSVAGFAVGGPAGAAIGGSIGGLL